MFHFGSLRSGKRGQTTYAGQGIPCRPGLAVRRASLSRIVQADEERPEEAWHHEGAVGRQHIHNLLWDGNLCIWHSAGAHRAQVLLKFRVQSARGRWVEADVALILTEDRLNQV